MSLGGLGRSAIQNPVSDNGTRPSIADTQLCIPECVALHTMSGRGKVNATGGEKAKKLGLRGGCGVFCAAAGHCGSWQTSFAPHSLQSTVAALVLLCV